MKYEPLTKQMGVKTKTNIILTQEIVADMNRL